MIKASQLARFYFSSYKIFRIIASDLLYFSKNLSTSACIFWNSGENW